MSGNPYAEPVDQQPGKRVARHIYAVRLRTPDPTVQPPLDFNPPQPASTEPTIDERFAAFHAANPQVYTALRALARQQLASGARLVRTKDLYERLRGAGVQTTGTEGYQLNNIFTSRYARLLNQEPDLAGRIPMRKLNAE